MLELILDFLLKNYLTIVTLVAFSFLVVIEMKTRGTTHDWAMNILILCIILMLISDYIDIYVANIGVYAHPGLTNHYFVRYIASAVGYASRPVIFMCCIILLYKTKFVQNLFLSIPAVLSVFLAFISLYNGMLFRITESNVYIIGDAMPVYLACIGFYVVMMVIFLIYEWKRLLRKQRIVILFILISITGSAVIDMASSSKNHILPSAILLSFFFFYLYNYSERKKEEIEYKTKELEIQEAALTASQIRPHFIYNTLNTIYSLCYENPSLAGETTLNFSSYLRSIIDLSKKGNTIPIEEELKHTEFYTNIEKQRFPEIEVIFDIDDGGYQVPFLIIQPMVENAIRHGVRGLKGGKVTISLYKEKTKNKIIHHIMISDNGNGKSRINTTLGGHSGIGISNVKSRIEKISNGKFSIEMTSHGTFVRMEIPEDIST